MLVCGHERERHSCRVCIHLRACREPWLGYVRWYTGVGMETELLCKACAEARTSGQPILAESVCHECFEFVTDEIGDLDCVGGQPEIRSRPEPFSSQLETTRLPVDAGRVIDSSPINSAKSSAWLLLSDDGRIVEFDADSGECKFRASAPLHAEPDHEPWCDHVLRHRLHVSPTGKFAAVVNDYGRHGHVVDLESGKVALVLDGGDYHEGTVPFSFAFAQVKGQEVAVHRTAWNRLDVSDPATGELLSVRNPTSYSRGEERPLHYLDYFHGALSVSPSGVHIADDGWVWHPVGVPRIWSLEKWVSENVWESEDGITVRHPCYRSYYWDHAMTWLDDDRIAIGGIGEDDQDMIEGARIFDVSAPGGETNVATKNDKSLRELISFAGPAGIFFGDGNFLYSADKAGLSRWDVRDGFRTGLLPGFTPTQYHRGARELVQCDGETMIRWKVDDSRGK